MTKPITRASNNDADEGGLLEGVNDGEAGE
jgi:hypothetical protein